MFLLVVVRTKLLLFWWCLPEWGIQFWWGLLRLLLHLFSFVLKWCYPAAFLFVCPMNVGKGWSRQRYFWFNWGNSVFAWGFFMENCTWWLFSNDGEYFFENVFFVDSGHFNVVFLFHFRSDLAPVDFQLNRDIFRDTLNNFDWNCQISVRFDEAIAWVHWKVILFVSFDLN